MVARPQFILQSFLRCLYHSSCTVPLRTAQISDKDNKLTIFDLLLSPMTLDDQTSVCSLQHSSAERSDTSESTVRQTRRTTVTSWWASRGRRRLTDHHTSFITAAVAALVMRWNIGDEYRLSTPVAAVLAIYKAAFRRIPMSSHTDHSILMDQKSHHLCSDFIDSNAASLIELVFRHCEIHDQRENSRTSMPFWYRSVTDGHLFIHSFIFV